MIMSFAVTLHLLAAVLWVGGMFFAYVCLRPAALALAPPQRMPLWTGAFARFFPWVWAAVVLLPATGYWMIFNVFGGMGQAGLYIHLMQGLGLMMIAIYLHVFFAPYRRFQRAVAAADFIAAGKQLGQIRRMIAINLGLGLLTVIVGSAGKYWH